MNSFRWACAGLLLLLVGCTTSAPEGIQQTRQVVLGNIQREASGNYFIGRRYFKIDYKFWGYVRKPGQPWSTAKLVMLNEQQKLAPDRAVGQLGIDANHEYKLYGYFSGETVYEPASNGFYPEFVLSGYELLSANPPNLFRNSRETSANIPMIARPMY